MALVAIWARYEFSVHARMKDREDRIAELKQELKDTKDALKDQTTALNRISDLIASWTPDAQRRRAGR